MNKRLNIFFNLNSLSVQLLIVSAIAFLCASPIIFFQQDHWDGAIITRALDLNDPEVLDNFYLEIGFPIIWLFNRILFFIDQNILNVSWRISAFIGSILVAIGHLLLIRRLFFPQSVPLSVALLIGIIPLSFLSTSSILGQFHMLYGLVLIGTSMLGSQQVRWALMGTIIALIGTQWLVTAPVAGVLGFVIVINWFLSTGQSKSPVDFFRLTLPFILVAAYVFVFIYLTPRYGLYAEYGAITIPSLGVFFNSFRLNSDTIWLGLLLVVVVIFIVLVPQLRNNKNVWIFASIIALTYVAKMVSNLPYILTERQYPIAFDIFKYTLNSQTLRYSVVGTSLIVIIICGVYAIFGQVRTNKSRKTANYLQFALTLTAVSSILAVLFTGWSGQWKLQSHKLEVVEAWTGKTWNENQICVFDEEDTINSVPYIHNFYEINHLISDTGVLPSVVACHGSYCRLEKMKDVLKNICSKPIYTRKYHFLGLSCDKALSSAQEQTEFVSCFVD